MRIKRLWSLISAKKIKKSLKCTVCELLGSLFHFRSQDIFSHMFNDTHWKHFIIYLLFLTGDQTQGLTLADSCSLHHWATLEPYSKLLSFRRWSWNLRLQKLSSACASGVRILPSEIKSWCAFILSKTSTKKIHSLKLLEVIFFQGAGRLSQSQLYILRK